jgi:hypothetical protein
LKKKSNKSIRNYFDFSVNKMGNLTEQDLGTLSERYRHLSNLMKSLLKSDLIIKNDKRYYFRDQVLRFWLAKTSLGKSHEKGFTKDACDFGKSNQIILWDGADL